MTPAQRAAHDAMVRALVDKGCLMAAGFEGLRLGVIPPDASQVQLDSMRMAYMLGAQHLYGTLMSVFDSGSEPTDNDVRRLELIDRELGEYAKSMKLLAVPTTGRH